MYWQRWSERLKGELGLATEPVAITFAGAPAPGGPVPHGKASVCQALKRASEGECIAISVETCGCPGGLVSLGLGQLPPDGDERLVGVLIQKEKGFWSRTALFRGPGRPPTTCDGCPPARPRGVHRPAGLPPPAHRPGRLLGGGLDQGRAHRPGMQDRSHLPSRHRRDRALTP